MRHGPDMLKPSQPFFVIDTKDFQQEIYLRQGISHFYSFRVDEGIELTAVPDGCIDIIFEYGEHEMLAFACGTVLESSSQHWEGNREIFGIRFLPGNLPCGLNTTLKDLIAKRVLLYDLIDDDTIIRRLEQETDFHQRIRVFLEEYTKFENKQEKPEGKKEICLTLKDKIYESDGLIRISSLSSETGYTERYLHKIFLETMGFSPKTFCKIIQFQNAIEQLNYGDNENMTDLAVSLGYCDQAKFIKDFKKYAGITPSRYLRKMRKENYVKRANRIKL